ncbi:MAG: hypothetical protein HUU38_22580 [Anaerolineales bacterium]|nr:hypothetical protein [Anaerolineales bacterium]
MKTRLFTLLGLSLLLLGFAFPPAGNAAPLFQETATAEPTATPFPTETPPPTLEPTATLPPPPTETPVPTATELPSGVRPLVVVERYFTEPTGVGPGSNFTLNLRLENTGQIRATNLIIVFTPGDIVPLETGGVLAYDALNAGDGHKFLQPMSASSTLYGVNLSTIVVTLTYNDDYGGSYTETFNLALPLTQPAGSGGPLLPTATPSPTITPTPTTTTTPASRPQLVVQSYSTDPLLLKPGQQFALSLDIVNTGNADARRITMILGGGSASSGSGSGTGSGGTTGGGGVSGGSGELTNFSPLGSSNVQAIGDVIIGNVTTVSQSFIVNLTTNPGAYPLKISFAYIDSSGDTFVDDQVITLLVQAPPLLELGFYRDPGVLFAGQPNFLPVQIINIGRKSAVLGNMRVTAGDSYIENNTILIGTLESGGYFTLDPMVIPNVPGPLEIQIEVSYTDDFNQPQTVLQTLLLEVQEAPIIEPPIDEGGEFPSEGEGFPPEVGGEETFWQKVVRFLKGLFGLDSGVQQPAVEPFTEPFTEEFSEPFIEAPKEEQAVPVP